MYIIGVTGGIACGKSTISNELSRYGGKIISADNMAHWQMTPSGEIYREYVRHFGHEILNEDDTLNRRKIADIVFNDKTELCWINQTTHPILLRLLRERLNTYQSQNVPIVVLDVPLLFEAGWDKECDEVWAVHLKRNLQIKRLMHRNNLSRTEAEIRIGAQIADEERRKKADIVINNSSTKQKTRDQIKKLMENKFPHLVENYVHCEEEIERLSGN